MTDLPALPTPEFLALQRALAGRYSLERELGRGGMGMVFLAREVALDRPVALKLLPPELAVRPGPKERFLREARTAARLSHPHIVPIHAVDEAEGFVFFAMAYVQGQTLGARVRERGPLSNAEGVRVLREVAWALAHAHLHGVIHRDVKPDNILLEEGTGRALVTDFGIAALAEVGEEGGSHEVVGTAEFMSPEQARGAEVDARSDLYSLGCVAFYALAGRVPFTGPTPAAVLVQHLTRPAPPLATVAPQVPAGVASAVDRCLRKELERRFPGAEALAEALSPDTQPDRELPVPLRVFIKESREFESVVSWGLLGTFFVLPAGISAAVAGQGTLASLLAAAFALVVGYPVLRLVRQARRLLRSGFTLADAADALLRDVARRNEEFQFQVGERRTWFDRVLGWLRWGGYGLAALPLAGGVLTGGVLGGGMVGVSFLAYGFLTGLSSSLILEIRARNRGDVMGERWLRFWKGLVGKGIFKLAGMGLKRIAAGVSGAHRPTEVAIGLAADRLFEELPRELRKGLKGLPETVRALEEDAQSMRRQVVNLDAVLAEIGDDDPARPGAEERGRVRAVAEGTRDEASKRLRGAVVALEKIRLGLLVLHSEGGTVESLTMDLEEARGLAERMEDLLAGHREVERLLEERRRTGMIVLGEGSPLA